VKILNRPVMVLVALWCVAVLLVPVALAEVQGGMQGPGGAGPATGGQGNMDQMQAPSSGGPGDFGSQGSNGGPGNGNGGQIRQPPSGGMGNGTMTAPNGTGNGNTTLRERPAFDVANMTATGGPGGFRGDGNITPPDSGNMTATGMRGGPGMHGNSTMSSGNLTAPGGAGNWQGNGTMTAPPDRPDGVQGDQNPGQDSGNQQATKAQQQTKEDLVASLISQLQALMSGKT